jgi:hypothetical protein
VVRAAVLHALRQARPVPPRTPTAP